MPPNVSEIDELVIKVQKQEKELIRLKNELQEARKSCISISQNDGASTPKPEHTRWPLDLEEYTRYGRQMILPEIGLQGQLQLKKASVLVVGVGGLGCPAASYLAGAGVGTLGLMDGDAVELSNLHRQILHTTGRIGVSKVESAEESLKQINPIVHYKLHREHLTASTAVSIFRQYDLVLDCTDHPTSRYLISDAAVLSGISLVSASALRTDGQLLVLNHPPKGLKHPGGPCYRCIFPMPPAPDTVLSCGEGGILGPVVGVMGVLMAVEVLKVLLERRTSETEVNAAEPLPHSMLIYSAFSTVPFRSLKMKGKRKECPSCSMTPSVTEDSLLSGSLDYAVFCGLTSPVNILLPHERVTAAEFSNARDHGRQVLLDVRDETQFNICRLDHSINIPFALIDAATEADDLGVPQESLKALNKKLEELPSDARIYTICRFGNDSQLTVQKLKALGFGRNGQRWIGDIRGGFLAWKREVDSDWPEY